jgi:hypothetical protein
MNWKFKEFGLLLENPTLISLTKIVSSNPVLNRKSCRKRVRGPPSTLHARPSRAHFIEHVLSQQIRRLEEGDTHISKNMSILFARVVER